MFILQAGETPFAQDATFGYKSSNLRNWIVEKAAQSTRKIDRDRIDSFDLARLRKEGPEYISRKLFAAEKGTIIVVNAADEADMDVIILGVLEGASLNLLSSHLSHPLPNAHSGFMHAQAFNG